MDQGANPLVLFALSGWRNHVRTNSGQPQLTKLHRTTAYRAIVDSWTEPVGLACSGGTDSTALLLVATWALRKGRVGPFVVLHVDHQTRPETADEQRHVESLARVFGVPFEGLRIEDAGTDTGSTEARLREARYDALAVAINRLGLEAVVTAHTLDDQVETILMRLISGAGGVALPGMQLRTQLETSRGQLTILRPLLEIRRSQLDEMLSQAGVEPLEDPTNVDTRYRRNAIRSQVVPALREIEPGFDRGLSRAVTIAARDADFCDAEAGRTFGEIVDVGATEARIDRAALTNLHPAIGSRVVRNAILALLQGDAREITLERVEEVRRAASGRTGARIEVPGGLVAIVERASITISAKE